MKPQSHVTVDQVDVPVSLGEVMHGSIRRWGTKGYGFIEAAELPDAEIWTHANFLVDPDYLPRTGDRVEFEMELLPDGRRQGRRVRVLTPDGRRQVDAPMLRIEGPSAALRTRLGTLGDIFKPAAPQAAVERAAPTKPTTLGAILEEHGTERAADVTRLETRRAKTQQEADELSSRLRALADDVAQLDTEIHSRQSKASADEQQQIANYLTRVAAETDAALSARTELHTGIERMRREAVERNGADRVAEYDEVRHRLDDARDGRDALSRDAFTLLEKDRRNALREYAAALDRLAAAPPVRPHEQAADAPHALVVAEVQRPVRPLAA